MPVITVSRQHGSGGEAIALRVCEMLDYQYLDKRLMAEALAQEGLTEREIVDYSEDVYKLRGFVDRLLGFRRPGTIADMDLWHREPNDVRVTGAKILEEHMAVWVVQEAIRAAYARGNVVIMGRGGQALLHDQPGVLHVRIEAPLAVRVQRVAEREGISEKKARETIVRHDKVSAEYLKRFYGVDWDDPSLYHLIINTGMWDQECAANCIAGAVACLPEPTSP